MNRRAMGELGLKRDTAQWCNPALRLMFSLPSASASLEAERGEFTVNEILFSSSSQEWDLSESQL